MFSSGCVSADRILNGVYICWDTKENYLHYYYQTFYECYYFIIIITVDIIIIFILLLVSSFLLSLLPLYSGYSSSFRESRNFVMKFKRIFLDIISCSCMKLKSVIFYMYLSMSLRERAPAILLLSDEEKGKGARQGGDKICSRKGNWNFRGGKKRDWRGIVDRRQTRRVITPRTNPLFSSITYSPRPIPLHHTMYLQDFHPKHCPIYLFPLSCYTCSFPALCISLLPHIIRSTSLFLISVFVFFFYVLLLLPFTMTNPTTIDLTINFLLLALFLFLISLSSGPYVREEEIKLNGKVTYGQ